MLILCEGWFLPEFHSDLKLFVPSGMGLRNFPPGKCGWMFHLLEGMKDLFFIRKCKLKFGVLSCLRNTNFNVVKPT